MQLVEVVGKSEYDYVQLFKGSNKSIKKYKHDFARLSSFWTDQGSEENTIRESPVMNLYSITMRIITTSNRMLKVLACDINKQCFDTGDPAIIGCVVHGTLDQWRDVVIRLLAFKDTNQLGQEILHTLDLHGLSGIFCQYVRERQGDQLLLT